MQLKAKFLGIKEDEFDSKEGQKIRYYRAHLFDDAKFEYYKLPISENQALVARDSGVAFGDLVEVDVEMKTDQNGKTQLKIVQW